MPVVFFEDSGEHRKHARYRQYQRGDRVVDLEQKPNVFSGATHLSFFRLDRLRATGQQFDPRIRPELRGRALRRVLPAGACEARGRPRPVGAVPLSPAGRRQLGHPAQLRRPGAVHGRLRARLPRRHPSSASSPRRRARVAPARPDLRAVVVPRRGREDHDPDRARGRPRPAVPRARSRRSSASSTRRSSTTHTVRTLRPRWRDILAHVGRGEDWHSTAAVTTVDRGMRLQRVVYRFVGRPPEETVILEGRLLEPAWAKTQAHIYYRPAPDLHADPLAAARLRRRARAGRAPRLHPPSARERPADRRARVDRVARDRPDPRIEAWPRDRPGAPVRAPDRARPRTPAGAQLPSFVAASGMRGCSWTGPNEADDNGERLFEYLREHRPDINAWFVISGDSPTGTGCDRAGARRVVAHGSRDVADADAERRVARVLPRRPWRSPRRPSSKGIIERPSWRYAFLQHGVTKDDLSRVAEQEASSTCSS